MQSGSSRSIQPAPTRNLSKRSLCSIEYPGYVKNSSVHLAINNLGGRTSLRNAFRFDAAKSAVLELSLHSENPFWHPAPGNIAGTHNIVLKITKRKRSTKYVESNVTSQNYVGDFKVEAVGTILKTVRFRCMVDFQYIPDLLDPIAQLREAMNTMNVQFLKTYVIPEEEDYTTRSPFKDQEGHVQSDLRCYPPPIFSRQGIPQLYSYKANNMSVVTTVANQITGEETKRLINKSRWKGYGPATIIFADPSIPLSPSPPVAATADAVDQRLYNSLIQHFFERPVWTRSALCNQFNSSDAREIQNSKALLPLVCYVFQDGPWRDTLVQFGYDPRKDPKARFFQRLYFRNLNHPIIRPSVINRRYESRHIAANRSSDEQIPKQDSDRSKSHIFDGVTLAKDTAAFQLCDIHDPTLKKMIEDNKALNDYCNERDGWYTAHALERIKTILRYKFFSLLDGHIATEEECLSLLQPKSGVTVARDTRKRQGKHNMAKGALPPENAALVRLRAKLDSNARNTWNNIRRPD